MTQVTHHPLFAIALTLAAFLIAAWLYRRSGWLVLQPVLVSVTLIVTARAWAAMLFSARSSRCSASSRMGYAGSLTFSSPA